MFVIFSLDTDGYKPTSWTYERMRDLLENEGMIVSLGQWKYKDVNESCIMVSNATVEDIQHISRICRNYKQECILIVKENYTCYFYDVNTMLVGECAGLWTISGAEPKGDYTKIGTRYYSILNLERKQ